MQFFFIIWNIQVWQQKQQTKKNFCVEMHLMKADGNEPRLVWET